MSDSGRELLALLGCGVMGQFLVADAEDARDDCVSAGVGVAGRAGRAQLECLTHCE
jgi:hypothetical protein